MVEAPLLKVENVTKHFPQGAGILGPPQAWVKAVDNVSLAVHRRESFGLVGESGCGKTTLGRLILRLIEPSAGRIEFDGQDITALAPAEMRMVRKRMQIIFQDPYSSLDPRMKVEAIVTEPLRAIQKTTRQAQRQTAAELLEKVGLHPDDLQKFPHEFSGGQRQRIGIARALCVQPELIVADEPVSALDVSIQAQVINLMADLKQEFGLAYVFISHDLSVVEHICDRIAVMYMGMIVESAPTPGFSRQPAHPYTMALLSAVPLPDPHQKPDPLPMHGDVPNPIDPPTGCLFHPRCSYCFDRCRFERPVLKEIGHRHRVACWLNDGCGCQGGIK